MIILWLLRNFVGYVAAIFGQFATMSMLDKMGVPPFTEFLVGIAVFLLVTHFLVKWEI